MNSRQRVLITAPGGYDTLQLENLPDDAFMLGGKTTCDAQSACPEGHVAVQVHGAGVNYADICIRWGLYGSYKRFVGYPGTPGFEFSGTVQAVGSGVAQFKPGQKVFGVTLFGAYATHVCVPASQLFALPSKLTLDEGAGFCCTALTAFYAIDRLASSRKGETVLIHSAAGGVGSMLVQLARARGCTVVGVVGRRAKATVAFGAGCDAVVEKETGGIATKAAGEISWLPDRPTEPLAGKNLATALETAGCLVGGKVRDNTPAVGPFNAVFDANGVATLRMSYNLLAPTGRLVVYGFHSMLPREGGKLGLVSWIKLAWDFVRTPRFGPMALTSDNRSVMGFNLSYLFDEQEALQESMKSLLELVNRGELKVSTVTTFQLRDVAGAHASLESGLTTGKIVLLC
ncbi:synaptic vesicle membrane protein VAT-1 [Pseudoscourfieldia marina]